MDITASEFIGNTAVTNGGNNIFSFNYMNIGDVTCDDGMNIFESSGGGAENDSDGIWPVGLCDE